MCQYSVFYGEYENEKKTGQKHLTFPNGDLNRRFLNKLLPTIWNLREIRSIELTVLKKSRLYLHVCYVNVNKLQMVFVRKKKSGFAHSDSLFDLMNSKQDHKIWRLHINNIQESDRGWYMCQVNTDPMRSERGFLEVVGK